MILDNQLPYKSPKEGGFPESRKGDAFLIRKSREVQEVKPVLLVGAKPCDVAAMKVLDEVFTGDKGRFKDMFYLNRRKSLTVVGLGCTDYKKGCFCSERGIDLRFTADCDGFLNITEDGFIYEPLTENGEGC